METEHLVVRNSKRKKKIVLKQFDLFNAFSKTERERNEEMRQEINRLINVFCSQERETALYISALPFDYNENKMVIEYIKGR